MYVAPEKPALMMQQTLARFPDFRRKNVRRPRFDPHFDSR
jgi:hypothetical protein